MEQITFANICTELTQLHSRKNHDYNDAYHRMAELLGGGQQFNGYAIGKLIDKLLRIQALTTSEAQVTDESIDDTLLDLASYSIMYLMELRRNRAQ